MREIKFRAWDKRTKKLRKVVEIVFNTGFNVEPNDNSVKLIWLKGYDIIEQKDIMFQRENRFELMQYTGLKDKNGKEIYKGDIVEYANRWKYIVCFGSYNKNPVNCAEAVIIGFYLKSIDNTDIDFLYSIDGIGARFPKHCIDDEKSEEAVKSLKLEVIGNIYENPELAKE